MDAILRARTITRLKDAVRASVMPLPTLPPVLKVPKINLDRDAMRLLNQRRMNSFYDIDDTEGIDNAELNSMDAQTIAAQNFRLLTGEMAGGDRKKRIGKILEAAHRMAQEEGVPYYIFAKSSPTSQLHKGLNYKVTKNFFEWQKYNYQGDYLAYEIHPSGMVRSLKTKPQVKQMDRLASADTRISLDVFRSFSVTEADHLAAIPELIAETAAELHHLGGVGKALAYEVETFLEEPDGSFRKPKISGIGRTGSEPQVRQALEQMKKDDTKEPAQNIWSILLATMPPNALYERKMTVLNLFRKYVETLPETPPEPLAGTGQSFFKFPVSDPVFKKVLLHMRFAVPFGARLKVGLAYLTRVMREQPATWKQPMLEALDRVESSLGDGAQSIFTPANSASLMSMYIGEWKQLPVNRLVELEIALIWDAYKAQGDAPVGALPETLSIEQWGRELTSRILPVMEKNEPNYREMRAYLEKKNVSKAFDLDAFKNRYEVGGDDGGDGGPDTDSISGDNGGTGGGGSITRRRVLGKLDAQERYKDSGITLTRRGISGITERSYLPEVYAEHLRQHQKDGCNLILEAFEKQRGFLLGDGTGAGKTMQELAVALNYSDQGKMVLIVTQNEKVAKTAFVQDLARFGKQVNGRLEYLPDASQPFDSNIIYITTYTRLVEAKEHQWDILIFDESHGLKNQRTPKPSAQSLYAQEMMARAEKILCATATPMDKPHHVAYLCDMWGLSFDVMMQAMGQKWTDFGYKRDEEAEITPEMEAKAVEDFFREATTKGLMVKREVSMANLDYINQDVELTSDWNIVYDTLNEEWMKKMDGLRGKAKAHAKGQWLMTMRRLIDLAKADATAFAAMKELESGRKVVVFCASVEDTTDIASLVEAKRSQLEELTDEEFQKMVTKLKGKAATGRIVQKLKDAGYRVEEMTGKISKGKIRKYLEDFQNNEMDCLVTTPQSGGTGINLDDTIGDFPRTIVMSQPPFSANDIIQTLGRINRMSTKSRAKAIQLSTTLFVDRWNQSLVASKLQRLGAAVGGDYGKIDLHKIADLDNGEIERYLVESGIYTLRPVPVGEDDDEPNNDPEDDIAAGPDEWFDIPDGQQDALDRLEMKAPFFLKRVDDYPLIVPASYYAQGAFPNPILQGKFGNGSGELLFDNWDRGVFVVAQSMDKTEHEISTRIRNGSICLVPPPEDIPELKAFQMFKAQKKDEAFMKKHGGIWDQGYKLWKVPAENVDTMLAEADDLRILLMKSKKITEAKQADKVRYFDLF